MNEQRHRQTNKQTNMHENNTSANILGGGINDKTTRRHYRKYTVVMRCLGDQLLQTGYVAAVQYTITQARD